MNNDPKNSIKQFLKQKIEIKETPPESVDKFIKKKLIEEPKILEQQRNSFWFRLKNRISRNYEKNTIFQVYLYQRKRFKRFMNETFPVMSFILFSCYIAYLMEYKYAQMKDQVFASKSLKQIQIEEENEVYFSLFQLKSIQGNKKCSIWRA